MWGNIFRISGVHKKSSSLPIFVRIYSLCWARFFIDIHKKTTRQRERKEQKSFSTEHIQEIIAKPANIFFDSLELVWYTVDSRLGHLTTSNSFFTHSHFFLNIICSRSACSSFDHPAHILLKSIFSKKI